MRPERRQARHGSICLVIFPSSRRRNAVARSPDLATRADRRSRLWQGLRPCHPADRRSLLDPTFTSRSRQDHIVGDRPIREPMRGGRKPPVLRSDYKSLAAGIVVQVVTLLDPEGLSFDLLGMKGGLPESAVPIHACRLEENAVIAGMRYRSMEATRSGDLRSRTTAGVRRPRRTTGGRRGQETSPNNRRTAGSDPRRTRPDSASRSYSSTVIR